MKYAIGQLVVNKKLGLGKVLEIERDSVTVFFKHQAENPRVINVGVVPMALAEEQTDEFLDDPNLLRKHGGRRKSTPRAKRTPANASADAAMEG